jgi:hypothetical protein
MKKPKLFVKTVSQKLSFQRVERVFYTARVVFYVKMNEKFCIFLVYFQKPVALLRVGWKIPN